MIARSNITGRPRGFTLTELLVVIAIVGIMAAILFPVLASVRRSSRVTQSLANLHAIGVALGEYRVDNKNCFPQIAASSGGDSPTFAGSYWTTSALLPYVPAPLQRPVLTIKGAGYNYQLSPIFIDPLVPNGNHHPLGDYGASSNCFALGRPTPILRITRPAMFVTVAAAERVSMGPLIGGWYFDAGSYAAGGLGASAPSNRGTGDFYLLFADGHVQAVPVAAVNKNPKQYFQP